jgi:hypothetical protein
MDPSAATIAVLPAFFIQARELVKFCLLHFNAWRIRHFTSKQGKHFPTRRPAVP